jgi:exosortase/archaeosortase family protein
LNAGTFTLSWRPALGALALILPGWLIQDASVLSGEALAGLILAATASFLVLSRLQEPAPSRAREGWDGAAAISLMALAAAVAFGAALAGGLRLNLAFAAMALLALGITTAVGGRGRLAALAVPILVLYVAVPLIPIFEATLTFPMRRLSALLASFLLSIGPVPVGLKGTEIYYGDLTVSVTSACDGLTLLQNLAWIAWWTVLMRHRGFFNRLAHGLIAVPAVLLSNTLRIVALALWAAAEGPEVLASAGHLYIAWTAVAVATVLFLAMESLFPATQVTNAEEAAGRSGSPPPTVSARLSKYLKLKT